MRFTGTHRPLKGQPKGTTMNNHISTIKTTARLFAATAATAAALGAAACSAPLETIEDPATHKTTSTVTVTESPATTAPRASDAVSVYQKGDELLSSLRAAGVPVYDLDAATVGKTGQEMCSALERDVPVQQLRALTVGQMSEFWDAEESDTFMVNTILTMCPEVIGDLD